MVSADVQALSSMHTGLRPTAYLIHTQSGELNSLGLYLQVREGFTVSDTKAMVSASELYSSAKVLRRIVGRSARTLSRQCREGSPARLNAQQSTVALKYARALEYAISVFGNQRLAEEWLGRPCRYLADIIPLELIDNSLGFQEVGDYLSRVELGIYQ